MAKGGLFGAKAYIEELEYSTLTAQNNLMDELEKNVKEFTPVRTGELKAGYYTEPAEQLGDDAYLFNDTPYHDYVNDGTPMMAPRNMVEKGIAMIDPDLKKYIRRG